MAYQVVARKWRPQQFRDVVGQDHITETLKYAVKADRVAPVYLFTGIRGTGKTTLARIMVKTLNCQNLGEDGEPCSGCENCSDIVSGKSPDVIEIDGASNNSVDDVRNIKENVTYYPVKSKYKIYIIDEVHMLSKSAFNALLKTLEEPPVHVVFILATTDPQKIPTTVLSRCQRYDLKRLSLESVVGQLEKILQSEKFEYEKDALYLIAREGDGSMRDSQTILEQLLTFSEGSITEKAVASILGNSDKNTLRSILKSLVERDEREVTRLARDILYSGASVEKAAKDLLYIIHDLLLYSKLNDISFIEASDEEKKWIISLASKQSSSDWIRLFNFWNGEYIRIKDSEFAFMIFEVSLICASTFTVMSDFKEFISMFKKVDMDSAVVKEKPKEEIVAAPALEVSEKKENNSEVLKNIEDSSAEILHNPDIQNESIPQQQIAGAAEQIPEKVDALAEVEPPAEQVDPEMPIDTVEEPSSEKEWLDFLSTFKEKDPYLYGAVYNAKFNINGSSIAVHFNPGLRQAIQNIEQILNRYFEDCFNGDRVLNIVWSETEKLSQADIDIIDRKNYEDTVKEDISSSKEVKELEQFGFQVRKIVVG